MHIREAYFRVSMNFLTKATEVEYNETIDSDYVFPNSRIIQIYQETGFCSMENLMYNAFYYEDNYYLLPEAFSDYGEFIDTIRNSHLPFEVQTVALREDHEVCNYSVKKGRSMAPYFLSGYHDEPVGVLIANAEGIYPAQVEIYDQEAYNEKLRNKILEICPGCLRYKPLSNRVQSLNGHFDEMGLDGVCFLRQETKPSPRIFREHLFSFGGFYHRFDYYNNSASEMLESLKQWFYIRYVGGELYDFGTRKELVLSVAKKELLVPILTNAISDYLHKISHHTYRVPLAQPVEDIAGWLNTILSKENREAFQKECKKYGVSIGLLEYAPQAAEKIRRSLKPLIDHFWMFPLLQKEGKEYYLLADTPYVLKELRYRSPLLQTFDTQISVYGQQGSHCYGISYRMPWVVGDL